MRLLKTVDGWWCEDRGGVARLDGFDIDSWLAASDPVDEIQRRFAQATISRTESPAPQLPLGSQEIWAAGVTYQRSKSARMQESTFSATAYDRVYDAARPELFFKANPRHCVGDGGVLKLRDDSKWMVPEPELALVISAGGRLVGYTIGDDLSCRDIEGENLLYLPQAKIWSGCCGIGPAILIADGSVDIRGCEISLQIKRDGNLVFEGSTAISRIKRSFDELIGHLFRNQEFPAGVILLTGTGIVPPETFTLRSGDEILMHVEPIGMLRNTVR